MRKIKYRHELKQEILYSDFMVLRQRLSVVLKRDNHTSEGKYEIRSLYFDDARDKALREKVEGVNVREKFRIRCYNGDFSFIKLEKKSKVNGLCLKESVVLTKEQTQLILDGNYGWMKGTKEPLLMEFYIKLTTQGLRPKTIVEYTREPFIYAPGNVRVTLDYNIRTGMSCTDFLDTSCTLVPTKNAPIILEVKWDEFLPDIIKDIVQLKNGYAGAFSKYAACRIYG